MADPSLSDVPSAGDTIAGKYVVERVLGVGGMGVVVAARHAQLGNRVAIKFMRDAATRDVQAVQRFVREARAAVALTSEHVARVIDVGALESGAPYIVMEYLEGLDLAAVLRRDGPMPVDVAAGLVLQACEAVAEAHALGIVHRDLKPANLFATVHMDGSVLVKVLDFGISKAPADAGTQSLTGDGAVMGSPGYMSPEQVKSARDVDARSDVWSLGVILYELLTGISPFLGDTLGATFAKIVSEPPPPLEERRPDLPAPLARVILRCLERERELRVQSVGELASVLVAYAPQEAVSARRIARISGTGDSARPVEAARPAGGATLDARSIPVTLLAPSEARPDPTGPGVSATHPGPAPWQAGGPRRRRVATMALLFGLPALAMVAGVALAIRHFGPSLTQPPNRTTEERTTERTTKVHATEVHATEPAPDAGAPQPLPSTEPPAAAQSPIGMRPGFLLFDADGDSIPDLLGAFEAPPGARSGSPWLGAVSGADGHVLWQSSNVKRNPAAGRRVLVGSTLLLVPDAPPTWRQPDDGHPDDWIALDARTGRPLWTDPAGPPVGPLCAGPDDLGFHVAGGALVRLVASTGAHLDPDSGEPCGHAYTSSGDGPNFTSAEGPAAARVVGSASTRATNIDIRLALVPVVGIARVLLGDEHPVGLPSVVVIAGGKILWRARLMDGGPDGIKRWGGPPRAAVRHGQVVVPYEIVAPSQERVTSFDLTTGERTWDVGLENERSPVDEIAVSSEGRVFARTGGGRVWTIASSGDDRRLLVGSP
jgi:eukaryotic-like serine/threonine-protein kinase